MSRVRSGLLAAWGSAFLGGRIGYDQALATVVGADLPHQVTGLPGADGGVPLGWALTAWRDLGVAALRLVLPVPGDPRGLPGPGGFSVAAMAAGEGVHGGGLALVPAVTRHGSDLGSAAFGVCWQAFADISPEVSAQAADPLAVSEAEHDLSGALREAASTLAAVDAPSWRPELAGDIARVRRVSAPALPPGCPPRAVRLLAHADRLAAVLELADADAPGGALTAAAATARAEALRPLWTAVRRARLAAYNA
jgi:hypothetical protein